MNIGCRMNQRTFRTEYFNVETGKKLAWKALKDTYAYSPPAGHKQYPILNSIMKEGEIISYDNMKYGYQERHFKLIEI